MPLVTNLSFVTNSMTSSTFSDETVSSQKNRTFRDEVEVVTIGSFIYKFDETHTHSTKLIFFPHPHTNTLSVPHYKSPATLCLSGDASPSVAVVALAYRRHRLPSQRFRCNRNASAPKRFRQCFAFLSPGYTSPFR